MIPLTVYGIFRETNARDIAVEILQKAGQKIADTPEFVLSTEAPDRIGDVVKIDGMDTKAFEANPVALFMHRHDQPIGVWSNLKKSAGALTGRLNLAAKGTSKLVDFAHAMIEQGMLKAVSVSFVPLDSKPNPVRGRTINKSELLEVSLVTIPMNPQALMIAKSFDFSDAEIKGIFTPTVKRDPNESLARARSAIIAAKRQILR